MQDILVMKSNVWCNIEQCTITIDQCQCQLYIYKAQSHTASLLSWPVVCTTQSMCTVCAKAGILNNNTCLMAIFQDIPGKLVPECHHSGFYVIKADGGDGDSWSYKMCKASVKFTPPRNNIHLCTCWVPFLTPNQQCQSTEGRKYHIPWTCSPQAHLGVFHYCPDHWRFLVTLGGLPSLSSALGCQAGRHFQPYCKVICIYKQEINIHCGHLLKLNVLASLWSKITVPCLKNWTPVIFLYNIIKTALTH